MIGQSSDKQRNRSTRNRVRPSGRSDRVCCPPENQAISCANRLVIEEAEIPERYRPRLRRLQRAVAEPAIADAMELEDEVLQELQDMERTIEREWAEKENERAEKERSLALLKQAGIDPGA